MAKAQNSASNIITRNQLTKLKLKAIRAGVWFKALPRIDRVLIDLTIQVTESIRSTHLAKSVVTVISKLEGLLQSKFEHLAKTIGRLLAERASSIAQHWGNNKAKAWSSDNSFALFLSVMQANK